jgi:hypothetical protein
VPFKSGERELFLQNHIKHSTNISFKIAGNREIQIDIKNIKQSKRTDFDGFKIYDCYVDTNDKIIYLLSNISGSYFWSTEVSQSLMQEFSNQFSQRIEKHSIEQTSCKIDKTCTIPCNKKCRTTGILLSVYNCGIVCGYRELFSSESLTQVAIFLLGNYRLL